MNTLVVVVLLSCVIVSDASVKRIIDTCIAQLVDNDVTESRKKRMKLSIYEAVMGDTAPSNDREEIDELKMKLESCEAVMKRPVSCLCNGGPSEGPQGDNPGHSPKIPEEDPDQNPGAGIDEDRLRDIIVEEFGKNEKLKRTLDRSNQALNYTQYFSDRLEKLERSKALDVDEQAAFFVYYEGTYTGRNSPIPFTGVRTNKGSHFSTSSHKFRCPVTGIYSFSFSIFSADIKGSGSHQYSSALLYQAGSVKAEVFSKESDRSYPSAHQSGTSVVLECQAGQDVWLQNKYEKNKIMGTSDAQTVFSGFLIFPL